MWQTLTFEKLKPVNVLEIFFEKWQTSNYQNSWKLIFLQLPNHCSSTDYSLFSQVFFTSQLFFFFFFKWWHFFFFFYSDRYQSSININHEKFRFAFTVTRLRLGFSLKHQTLTVLWTVLLSILVYVLYITMNVTMAKSGHYYKSSPHVLKINTESKLQTCLCFLMFYDPWCKYPDTTKS